MNGGSTSAQGAILKGQIPYAAGLSLAAWAGPLQHGRVPCGVGGSPAVWAGPLYWWWIP